MDKERGAAFVPAQAAADFAPSSEIPAPPVRKTPLMLSVEQRFAAPGESIGQLLARLYVEENLNFGQMSRRFAKSSLKVSESTLGRWTKALNPQISIRSLAELRQDPRFEQYRISQIGTFWQDPEKKRLTIEKRNQNPGYINRKSLSSNPELLAKMHRRSAEALKRKARQKRSEALGKNPRKALRSMAIEQGLSVSEIAILIGESEYAVRLWLKEYKIKPGRKPPERRKRQKITDEAIEQRREKIKRAQAADLFKYLTPRQQKVLLALYPEQGTVPTQQKVAHDLHLTRERIRQLEGIGLVHLDRLLTDSPDALKMKGQRISAETLTDLHQNQGLTQGEIAHKLGVSAQTISRRMNELKIPVIRRRKRGSPINKQ